MYSDKDKTVYASPDASLVGDPLAMRRRLLIHSGGKLHEWIDLFNGGTELEQAQAEDDLVRATRAAFNLKPGTEKGGVCDATVLEYLAHFLEWLLRPSAPPTRTRPTSPPCTDCPPPR